MKPISLKRTGLLVAAGIALAGAGYWLGTQRAAPEAGGTGPAAVAGRRVLYWHDPMVPGQRFDKPGKSPFMDMQLVPVYADEDAAAGVTVSPTLQQNLGIRYATVRRADVADTLELVGSTEFDASAEEVIQSRAPGFIDKLHVRSPLQRVRRGQAVATLFVPEWIAPQEEYLALARAGDDVLAAASRQRMRALAMPESLIAELARSGRVQSRHTLTAPIAGIVSELGVREGAQVTPGMTIAKVVGMDTAWLLAEVPEALIGAARPGMQVVATGSADPQRTYGGKVRELLPGVNAATRTARARIELDNRDGSLTPGMLMRVRLSGGKTASKLLVPSEAVIASGTRSVVLVVEGANRIRPAVVATGREVGDDTEITAGLAEGQQVVASGQFLIDSEANLKSVLPKLAGSAAAAAHTPAQPAATTHAGVGKVEQVTDEALTLSHGPIPTLQWPPMTMDFRKPGPGAFQDIRAGQVVEFEFVESEDGYELKKVVVSRKDKP